MKTIFVSLTVALAITAGAQARLSETPDQCAVRYGSVKTQHGEYSIYYVDHFDIAVKFRDGKSVEEVFSPNMGGALSEEKVAELLTANSAGSRWESEAKSGYTLYSRADGIARATLQSNTLTIRSDTSKNVAAKQPGSGF